jgi:hypothetical protein
MLEGSIDAITYFRALDQEIDAMFKRLDRPPGTGTTAKDLARKLARSLIRRSQLFDAIVIPELRKAAIKEAVIYSAERDQLAIWLLATDLLELPVGRKFFDKYLRMLEERFHDRVESDESHLWPAASASGVDLIRIADRLKAVSYDDARPPPWVRRPGTGPRIPR